MNYRAVQGQDLRFESTTHAIVRVQGQQWRIEKPTTGVAVFEGRHTRTLLYYGGKPIKGTLWIGKTRHSLTIEPRG